MTVLHFQRLATVALLCAFGAAVASAENEAERLATEPTASPAAPRAPIDPATAANAKGDQDTARASIVDRDGKRVGLVTLTATPAGTIVNGEFTGLPAGIHGFHVHAVGKCEPPFDSAGPHFNPSSTHHGVAVGPGHAGDLPNLFVSDSGRVHVEFFAPELSIRNGDRTVFDADGSALVVHAKRDDYKTDPSGDSGDRIACGVIER
jgi:Cu-Zn family superoxide dismutase